MVTKNIFHFLGKSWFEIKIKTSSYRHVLKKKHEKFDKIVVLVYFYKNSSQREKWPKEVLLKNKTTFFFWMKFQIY